MSENLKKALRADIACYEASMMTTPHLSRIHHAEAALLALLEEKVRPAPPPQREVITFIVHSEVDGLGRRIPAAPSREEGDDLGLWSTG